MTSLQELEPGYIPDGMFGDGHMYDIRFIGEIFDHILLFGLYSVVPRDPKQRGPAEPNLYYLYNMTIRKSSKCFKSNHIEGKIFRCDVDGIPIRYQEFWEKSKNKIIRLSKKKRCARMGSHAFHDMSTSYHNPDVLYISQESLLLFKDDTSKRFTAINIDTMDGLYDSEYQYLSSTDNYHIFSGGNVLTKSFELHEKIARAGGGEWLGGDSILVTHINDYKKHNIYDINTGKYRFPINEEHSIKVHKNIIVIDDKLYIRKMKDDDTITKSGKNKSLYDSDVGDYTIILADGSKRHVVSYILSMESEYFRAMFESKMRETANNTIDFKDYNKDVIIDILKYIYYYGKTNSTDLEYLFELYRTADMFRLDSYLSYIENRILNMKTMDNIKSIILLCVKYQNDSLLTKI